MCVHASQLLKNDVLYWVSRQTMNNIMLPPQVYTILCHVSALLGSVIVSVCTPIQCTRVRNNYSSRVTQNTASG